MNLFMTCFRLKKLTLKKSWGSLNEAFNRHKEKIDLPNEFIYKNKTITNAIEIVNSFNEYFANIGPIYRKKSIPQ